MSITIDPLETYDAHRAPWENELPAIDDDDVFGEPEELEKFEAWKHQEIAAAKKETAQVKRDFKEELNGSGIDIVDYCHSNDIPLDSREAEQAAARAGYHQTTWNDARNVTRRAKERDRKIAAPSAAQLRAAVANKPEPAKVAPKVETKPARDYEAIARDYFAAAIETAPAKASKLQKSLEYQLSQFEATVSHFIEKGKSETEAAAIWLQRAQMAADAKTR